MSVPSSQNVCADMGGGTNEEKCTRIGEQTGWGGRKSPVQDRSVMWNLHLWKDKCKKDVGLGLGN